MGKELKLTIGEQHDMKDRMKSLEEDKEAQADRMKSLEEDKEAQAKQMESQAKMIVDLNEKLGNKDREIADLKRRLAEREETKVADTSNSINTAENADTASHHAGAANAAQAETIQILMKAKEDLQEEVKETKTILSVVVEENKQFKDQISATNANTIRRNEFGDHLAHHARNVEEFANMDREIMAFRVEEKEEKDFKVRMTNEREMVIKILKAIDGEWDQQGLIGHRRIGKFTPGTKPRPLKIT